MKTNASPEPATPYDFGKPLEFAENSGNLAINP
jgi:hypothetical protein